MDIEGKYLSASLTMSLIPIKVGLVLCSTITFSVAHDVFAIYFGDWHVNDDMSSLHGPNWTEWELVVNAKPRWEGHHQPNLPKEDM